jgi:hypothetical protein
LLLMLPEVMHKVSALTHISLALVGDHAVMPSPVEEITDEKKTGA